MTVSWVLAVVARRSRRSPLYAHYAHLASRPAGSPRSADQQLAAGVMWVPGSITFVIVVFVYVHRWLDAGAASGTAAPRLASEH